MKEVIYLFRKPDGEHGCIEAVDLENAAIELYGLYGSGIRIIPALWPDNLTIMDINDSSRDMYQSELQAQSFYLEIKDA